MFRLRNEKINFLLHTLIWRPEIPLEGKIAATIAVRVYNQAMYFGCPGSSLVLLGVGIFLPY